MIECADQQVSSSLSEKQVAVPAQPAHPEDECSLVSGRLAQYPLPDTMHPRFTESEAVMIALDRT